MKYEKCKRISISRSDIIPKCCSWDRNGELNKEDVPIFSNSKWKNLSMSILVKILHKRAKEGKHLDNNFLKRMIHLFVTNFHFSDIPDFPEINVKLIMLFWFSNEISNCFFYEIWRVNKPSVEYGIIRIDIISLALVCTIIFCGYHFSDQWVI